MDNPWDKQPEETIKAYEAFNTYLLLGPNRSLKQASASLGRNNSYKSWLEHWSRKYNWVVLKLTKS